MSDEGATKHPRPSQVSLAGWVTVTASALLVFALFEDMSALRGLDLREGVEDYLSQPPGSSISLTVDEMLGLLRIGLMVAGACAAASLVLGIHILKGNNAARIALLVPAILLFLGALLAPMTGSFLAVMVAVSAVLLWSRPAKDWFAGRPPRPDARALAGPGKHAAPSRKDPTMTQQPPSSGDRPDPQHDPYRGQQPYPGQPPAHPGQPPAYPAQGQPPYGQPTYGQPAYPQQGQEYGQNPYQPWPGAAPAQQSNRGPDKRPGTVTAAAWLTWVFTMMTALFATVMVGVFAAASDEIIADLRSDPVWGDLESQLEAAGLSVEDLTSMMVVVGIVALVWCVTAFVVAIFAFRRHNWARIVLVVSASMSALLSLLAIGSIVTVFPLAASIATIVLLFVGGANDWYARRGGMPTGYDGGPGPGGYAQQQPGTSYPGQDPQDPPKAW